MKTHLFTRLLCILSAICFSQNTNQNFNDLGSFPRSPEAAALSKQIDIPAGTYNGVVNFTIPIYTIEESGYSLPISLSYSTTGITVGEISSRVGLGWSLNTGGVVLSKQVMGYPDSRSRPIITNTQEFEISDGVTGGDINDPFYYTSNTINGYDGWASENMINVPFDMQPDIFSYSTLNSGGHFIFDSDGSKGIPIPFNEDKINYVGSGTSGIKIIDTKGIQYRFGDSSTNLTRNSCSSHLNILGDRMNDYKIGQIIFQNGNTVDFNYKTIINTKFITSYSIVTQRIASTEHDPRVNTNASKCYNFTDLFEDALTEISFSKGKVQFFYGDRLDIKDEKSIERILVTNNSNDTIAYYNLVYDYFISPNEKTSHIRNVDLSNVMMNDIYKRLKLVKVINNLTKEEYNLSYYEDHKNPLPHRLSIEQDYWGRFNGKYHSHNNETYTSIPTTKYHVSYYGVPKKTVFLGSDKSPDFNFGVLGNLKEIQNPMGGVTKITYEPDDYYVNENLKYNYELKEGIIDNQSNLSTQFDVVGDTYLSSIICTEDLETFNSGSPPPTTIGDPKVNLFDPNNNLILNNVPCPFYKTDINLTQGTYTLKIVLDPIDNNNKEFFAKYSFVDETKEVLDSNKKIGSLRISKIEVFDKFSDTQASLTREYIYKDSIDTKRSSGVNHGDNELIPIRRIQYPTDRTALPRYADLLEFSSNPGWNLYTINGKSVGYTYVQERVVSTQGKSYKKTYRYNNDIDPQKIEYNPYDPLNITWRNPFNKHRGMLQYDAKYDSENKIVESNRYFYDDNPYFNRFSSMYNQSSAFSERIGVGYDIKRQKVSILGLGATIYHRYKHFDIQNTWIQNVKTINSQYKNNAPIIINENLTKYHNINPTHTFPVSQITTNSLGETLKTEYYYPLDLPNKPKASELITANRIADPLVIKNYNNNIQLSEQETEYALIGGKVLPKYVYTKKGSVVTSSDRKITYNDYDNLGNLKQYTMENGVPVSIIWGYNGQYPIAKIEGKTYSSIQNLALTLIGLSNNGNLNHTSFKNLQELEGALVTGYIYKPLVGVTTIIHPNGQYENYNYDNAGRLKSITDENGNILKQVEYNYGNQ